MDEYHVCLRKSDCTEWTLTEATTMKTVGKDIVKCPYTGDMHRVVLRFKAPSWVEARKVFLWKSEFDLKVPKHVLEWEEARIMLEQEHPHVQVAENKV